MDNITSQIDEIEALFSIYGKDWVAENDMRSYRATIVEDNINISLYLTLPKTYPSDEPPQFELSAPTLTRSQKQEIVLALNDLYLDHIGEPIIYLWIEKIRELLVNINTKSTKENSNVELVTTTDIELEKSNENSSLNVPRIFESDIIQDRRSTFLGHAAAVRTKQDVENVMDHLKQNKKIAQATHNILAYRIRGDKNMLLQDCDDDGETHAGGRLLHLLNILDIDNVIVVVTRWYGGVHLCPDRFRHINNAGRQALQKAGFILDKK